MLSITKIFRFEAAHAITGYDGPCSNIHGHSYELHVTVSSPGLDEKYMVVDYKDLKTVVNQAVIKRLDHALMLKGNEQNERLTNGMDTKIHWMTGEPTSEYLLQWMAKEISPMLGKNVQLKRLRLYETATCYAEWEWQEIH